MGISRIANVTLIQSKVEEIMKKINIFDILIFDPIISFNGLFH